MSSSSAKKQNIEDMSLLSISDGENARGIPIVKFIEDVEAFANSFSPAAEAELLIGAYSELHSKFKTFETSLNQKSEDKKTEVCRALVDDFTHSFAPLFNSIRTKLFSQNS
jgi:hypothetical protein